eukprot:483775-Prymnesium_polylepis.1
MSATATARRRHTRPMATAHTVSRRGTWSARGDRIRTVQDNTRATWPEGEARGQKVRHVAR